LLYIFAQHQHQQLQQHLSPQIDRGAIINGAAREIRKGR